MTEQVTESLRAMILMGELLPGARITQDELATELRVSTMPVREALLALAHEGFVDVRKGRSFQVAVTTRSDIADVYWLHAIVSGELTARAAERIDEAGLDDLSSAHEDWIKAGEAGDTTYLESANFAFHRVLNKAARSPRLLMVLRQTLRMIPEHFYSLIPDWYANSTHGHSAILEAVRSRDAALARREAMTHVEDAGNMLLGYFDDQGYWMQPPMRNDVR